MRKPLLAVVLVVVFLLLLLFLSMGALTSASAVPHCEESGLRSRKKCSMESNGRSLVYFMAAGKTRKAIRPSQGLEGKSPKQGTS